MRESRVVDETVQSRTVLGLIPQEPGAEDHVGFMPRDRTNHLRDVARIVFQVGILNDDRIALAAAKPVRSAAPLPSLRALRMTRS